MGHDIYLNKISKPEEIGYLRRSMSQKCSIYDILDCDEFNNGISGSGESKLFELDNYSNKDLDLMATKARLTGEEDLILFVGDFIDCLKKNRYALINFY